MSPLGKRGTSFGRRRKEKKIIHIRGGREGGKSGRREGKKEKGKESFFLNRSGRMEKGGLLLFMRAEKISKSLL